jgi:hemolysin activation/secretion protein
MRTSKRLTLSLTLLILPAALAGPARAADPSAPASSAIKVTGLLFVSDPNAVQGARTPDVTGVAVKVNALDRWDFKERMRAFLGQPLTQETRDAVVASTVRYFRELGHPLVDVSLPPQELTGGVLQVLVVQGKIGKVNVDGAKWFSPAYIASQVHANPGDDVDATQLGNDLDWLNRNPFRQVDLVYAKGSELGQTDVIVKEVDDFPVRVYGGYEDSGTQSTGENRVLTGLNWGNVFGIDGQMNYQYMADPAFRWFRSHSASWIQPLPWRHILTISGSYVDTHADETAPFDQSGFNDQVSLRYEVPLPKFSSDKTSFQHSFTAGFDWKRANNNLAFGGTQVFGSMTDILQWSAGYSAGLKDPIGESSMRLTYFVGPGHWDANESDAVYNQSRAGAASRYQYVNMELDRTTGLPWNFMLVNRFTFQLSDANLLASEQLGFGGYDTIRGYDTRVVNADEGYILSTELRTPPMTFLPHVGLPQVSDKFQFLAFFDYGSGTDHNRLAGEPYQTVLAGVGPGLRYSISTHFSLRADYGWQLHDAQVSRTYASRSHIGIVVGY